MKSKLKIFMTILFVIFLNACTLDDAHQDNSHLDTPPLEEQPNEPSVETGWHRVRGELGELPEMSYVSYTMNQEAILTTVTLQEINEGNILIEIEQRWHEVHENALISFHQGRYHWEEPLDFVALGSSLALTMWVEPLIPGIDIRMSAHRSYPYRGVLDPSIHTVPFSLSGTSWFHDAITGLEPTTLKTHPFEPGEVGEVITIRITLFNASTGMLYWYYTYEWLESDEN